MHEEKAPNENKRTRRRRFMKMSTLREYGKFTVVSLARTCLQMCLMKISTSGEDIS
jgi:hypothetical protein